VKKGYTVFDELPDPFPEERYTDSTTFEVAVYIFKQSVKRDTLIRKSKARIILVDRHPYDCIFIAEGFLDDEDKKIKSLYKEFNFLKGVIVLFDRLGKRTIDSINKVHYRKIIQAYLRYSEFVGADLVVDGTLKPNILVDEIKAYIENYTLKS